MSNFLANGLKKRESSNWMNGIRHVKYNKPPKQKTYPYIDSLPNLPFPMNNIKLIRKLNNLFNLNGLEGIVTSKSLNKYMGVITMTNNIKQNFNSGGVKIISTSNLEQSYNRRLQNEKADMEYQERRRRRNRIGW